MTRYRGLPPSYDSYSSSDYSRGSASDEQYDSSNENLPTNSLFSTVAVLLNTSSNEVANQVSDWFDTDSCVEVERELRLLLDKVCHGRRWNGRFLVARTERRNIAGRLCGWLRNRDEIGVGYVDDDGNGHTAVVTRGHGGVEYRCYENDSDGDDVTDDVKDDELTAAFWFN